MTFDPSRLDDPTFFAENRLPAHSDHRWFADRAEASGGTSSFEQSLNGLWKLHYAPSPAQAIEGFWALDHDCSGFDDIPVPGHLQLHGYDRPQYTNVQYPWDGQEAVEIGRAPRRFNPVASYVRLFTLDRPLADGERLVISFKGAESALAVWLNGRYLGYACDSFTPSEFDLTDALVGGENKLAAQVFKWSAASWIEDQDFYRFSGLFRDVVLYRRPAVHLEDLRITTTVDGDLAAATVTVRPRLTGAGRVVARLAGVGELTGEGPLGIRIEQPRLWSAEDPHLYDLELEVYDSDGGLTEYVPQRVGVRRFGIEDGLLRINGQRIVFKGVNRHEFGLDGRVMSREQTEADLALMKRLGINAVRTSHYPNNSFFYELCDSYGLYVIDEMNLESHGLWDLVARGDLAEADAVPGDRPEWRAALLDRAASMLERDKNHPSIVMWSCGNESYGGLNIHAVAEYFRAADERPVHYEGVTWDPRHLDTTDVASQMYTPAAEVEEFLRTHRDKPFVLCEYAHAMGNSFGAVDKYLELAYREPLFQGGFIWDFADQAIALTDRHGQRFFGYGGDAQDAPSDYDFCGNGILFADHTPKPLVQEVKYLYQGLKLAVAPDGIEVTNRLLFTDSSAYDCVVSCAQEGRVLAEAGLDTAVPPGETRRYRLPFAVPSEPGEYTLDVSFRLREATAWAPAGYEVASGQGVVTVAGAVEVRPRAGAPEFVPGGHNYGVRGARFSALFSRIHGGLVSYRYGGGPDGGRELLCGIPQPCFWHAPTSNERGWGMPARDGQWLLASRYATASEGDPTVTVGEDAVELTYHLVLPTTPASSCEVAYRVDGAGRIEVTLTMHPGEGLSDPPEVGMLLLTDAALHTLRWYGEGPQECYVDRRGGARLGVYTADVAGQLTPYLRPQEAGSRTGVRWASVTDDLGWGLRLDASGTMDLSALPWTPFEIENAAHHVDLPPVQHTVLRPALMRRGVGGDQSWGAMTHPEYRLPTGDLVFRFGFQGTSPE